MTQIFPATMNKTITRHLKYIYILFVLFFFSQKAFCQLSTFTLTVTNTDETCTGNGTLSFSVSGTSPGATVFYSIYLLPNTTTPIAVVNGNTITGLVAGNYSVVAQQNVGSQSNTQQQTILISNMIVPLNFTLAGSSGTCSNTAITATVLQGQAVSYEIISGPIIRAPQSSNVFSNLSPGTYNVRVTDICGDAIVQTFTLQPISTSNLEISQGGAVPLCTLVNCTTQTVQFSVASLVNTTIIYPLTVTFTVFPPGGGAPVITTQTIASGGATTQAITINGQYIDVLDYNYAIAVTDFCGNTVSTTGALHGQIEMSLSAPPIPQCFKSIFINVCHFTAPYTVNFLSAPAGFNPLTFNGGHPGPFTSAGIKYLSTPQNTIPVGIYEIQVTDACGRTIVDSIDLQYDTVDYNLIPISICSVDTTIHIPYMQIPPATLIITQAPPGFGQPLPYDATSTLINNTYTMLLHEGTYTFTGVDICGRDYAFTVIILPPVPATIETIVTGTPCMTSQGQIHIEAIDPPTIFVTAMVTQAPAAYNHPLPFDVSNFITSNTIFYIAGLPAGDYVISLTDSCGHVFIINANVPSITSQVLPMATFLNGCSTGFSSIHIVSPNGNLQQVIITGAPAAFAQALPFNVSFNINFNGEFYMNSLQQGTYTIYTKDLCDVEHTTSFVVPGYLVTRNDLQVIGNCGSFDLLLNHTMTAPYYIQSFWLQKLNVLTNQWEHPITGAPYITGAPPYFTNSIYVNNNAVTYNIASLGTFRIIKSNYVYSNGSTAWTECINVIHQFEFTGELKITSAYVIPCQNSGSVVYVIATGIAPLRYKITEFNGAPFVVDNGTSNIFSGLAPGIYNFQVSDLCGNIVNRLFNITALPAPTITASSLCEGQSGQLSVQFLPFLNYQWWNGANPSVILSTTNVLSFNPFTTALSPGTYFVRIYSPTSVSCIDQTLTYTIPSISAPNAGLDQTTTMCGNQNSIDLFSLLVAPYDLNGVWQETTTSGMLIASIWQPIGIPYGTYTFTYRVDGLCNDFDEATVVINFLAPTPTPIIAVSNSLCDGLPIQFSVQNIPNATYSWIGPDNFTSILQNPIIADATQINNGEYFVHALTNGCDTSSSIMVNLNQAPDFEFNSGCISNTFTVSVHPLLNSFDQNTASYSWTGPNNYSNNVNPITITDSNFGEYFVTVTNGGCSTTKPIMVNSSQCGIQSWLSPNDDDINDSFVLSGFDVEKLEIYSRWGRLVYDQDNYLDQWHGQNNSGGHLPDSTYFYFAQLRSGEMIRGWVFLMNQ